jgi:acetyltransferase-like isoleucine patch superfamily enzyme
MFKLASWCKIEFKNDVLVGWDCLFIDTDFHTIVDITNQTEMTPSLPIFVGEGCWFANKCTVLKNTNIPDKCIIASNSLLNKEYRISSNSLLAGIPATLKKTGVYYKNWE